jgi:hypothetical protein
MMIAVLSILMALPATTSANQSKNNNDPLKPYTTCKSEGDLEVRDISRGSKSAPKYREVTTAKGEHRVSVIDGYRVMFGYKDVSYYYANVKIEQSDPQSYAQDKGIVIDELKHLTSSDQASKILFADKAMLNGFEHYGIDRDAIDVGGVISIHVLFYEADNLIITIYFLNQEKKKRRFNNVEEYRTLRDSFLNRYTECLKAAANH